MNATLRRLGFGKEKESFRKLNTFLRNPVDFYEKNTEQEETLIDFMSFILRVSMIIRILLYSYSGGERFLIFTLFFTVFAIIVLARAVASISLYIGSAILNFIVKLFSQKDDKPAAQRVVAYAYVVSLIPSIPKMSLLIIPVSIIVSIILLTVGVSKQYRIGAE